MDSTSAQCNWIPLAVVGFIVVAACSAPASEPGEAAADQVTEASYRYFLGDNEGTEGILYTHSGDDRRWGPEHDLARANIVDAFEGFGLSVVLEPFTYSSTTYYNVVATMEGTVYPFSEYIVGAHFDSVGNPGADDNASGTAAVLEIARVLSQYESEYTIRFIAFDREEQGLIGSDAYVTDHQDDDIRGMISMDMVSWSLAGTTADIYGRTASSEIKTALAEAVNTYGQGIVPSILGALDGSDHAPFEWQGFQACLFIETWGNPYYHTDQDSVDMPDYINYDYARRMTRSVVGYLVDNANVFVPVADGDYDSDGDVDLEDFRWFQVCFSGDGYVYPPDMGCQDFDFDGDQDVDLDDYAGLNGLLSGPYFEDCNENGIPDQDDIRLGYSEDCNDNGIPDECEPFFVYYLDDLETDQGWTVGAPSDDATTGIWTRVDPNGTSAQPEDDHTEPPGVMCFVTGQGSPGGGAGENDVDDGRTTLTSPAFDLLDVVDPTLGYWRWYSNSAGADPESDIFEVYVSDDDGLNWTTVEIVGPSGSDVHGGWIYHEFLVSDLVTPTAQVRLRFVASDEGPGSLVEAGVDDLVVTSPVCGN